MHQNDLSFHQYKATVIYDEGRMLSCLKSYSIITVKQASVEVFPLCFILKKTTEISLMEVSYKITSSTITIQQNSL